MLGLCDSCEERVDHLYDLTQLPEFVDVVRRLNYRKVCQICYDDLYDELRQQRRDSQDRRSETRYAIAVAVEIAGVDREGKSFLETATTQDISFSGARVIINHSIEPGSVLKLRVPEQGIEVVVIIEVVWRDGDTKSAGLKLAESNESWINLVQQKAIGN
jgi:hypothetical protein